MKHAWLYSGRVVVAAFSLHVRIRGNIFDQSIPACAFFLFFFKWRSVRATNSTLQAKVSSQWLSGVCVFRCNLPLALWQNDRDLLRATAVTRKWNGQRIRALQHRQLTLEKKILPPLLPGLELATFRARRRRSTN